MAEAEGGLADLAVGEFDTQRLIEAILPVALAEPAGAVRLGTRGP